MSDALNGIRVWRGASPRPFRLRRVHECGGALEAISHDGQVWLVCLACGVQEQVVQRRAPLAAAKLVIVR